MKTQSLLSVLLQATDNGMTQIISIVSALTVVIFVFLLLRVVMLWYWKVNITVKELKEINMNIKVLLHKQGGIPVETKDGDSWTPVAMSAVYEKRT